MLSLIFIAILAARCISALPEALATTPATCGPAIQTSAVVITYETFITIPHSCYSYSVTAAPHFGCPTYSCPAHPDCVTSTTKTTYIPPKDACCPTTGTTTFVGPCSSCQIGCSTQTIVKTVTTTPAWPGTTTDGSLIAVTPHITSTRYPPPTPTSITHRIVKKEPQELGQGSDCTTTIFRGPAWELGPTRTAYLWTETATSTADCGGCDYIVDKALNGVGPAVLYTVTYRAPVPTTTTEYVCGTLW